MNKDDSSSLAVSNKEVLKKSKEKKTKKVAVTKQNAANKQIFISLLIISIISTLGTTPFALIYILKNFVEKNFTFKLFEALSRFCLFSMHGSHFYVLYFFNRNYRQALHQIIIKLLKILHLKKTKI